MSKQPCLRIQRHYLLLKTKGVRALLDIYSEDCSLSARLSSPAFPQLLGTERDTPTPNPFNLGVGFRCYA